MRDRSVLVGTQDGGHGTIPLRDHPELFVGAGAIAGDEAGSFTQGTLVFSEILGIEFAPLAMMVRKKKFCRQLIGPVQRRTCAGSRYDLTKIELPRNHQERGLQYVGGMREHLEVGLIRMGPVPICRNVVRRQDALVEWWGMFPAFAFVHGVVTPA